MIVLDVVWPALYVTETFYHFWFLVIGTIVIETFVIKFFLKFSLERSALISLVGNCVSGFVGTFIMMWGMMVWHLMVDSVVPGATFGLINWIATYVWMCLGSVFLETLAVKLIFKESIKCLFLPMLTGNFLSYAFIAFVMYNLNDKDPNEARAEVWKYLPNRQAVTLHDSSTVIFDTATIRVAYDKDDKRLNEIRMQRYPFAIPFRIQNEHGFQFELIVNDDNNSSGMDAREKLAQVNELTDTYIVWIEQKNPDTAIGWQRGVITDTLIFNRIK